MAHQTLLYEVKTGKLLRVEPSLYINKAKDKEKYCPGHKHSEIGVYYLDGAEPVGLNDVIVRPADTFGQRLVLTKDGRPLSLERIIQKFFKICSGAAAIKFECEGGLGDHLLQAAACLEFKALYPEKWVGLAVKQQYEEILKKIEGLDLIGFGLLSTRIPPGTVTVSGRTEYMTDPRGLGYGKQSLYGSRLGLEAVQRIARIHPDPEDLASGAAYLKTYQRDPKRPLIGIQFGSASGRGKSWPLENVRGLVRLIYGETDCEAVIFGRDWEYPVDSPLGINMTGPVPWITTFQVLCLCAEVICIDSGIMHLARSLEKPYIGLWGGSTPEYIHGEKTGPFDIRVDLPCKDKLCMECPDKHVKCMRDLKPEMVMDVLIKVIKKKEKADAK